MIEEKKPVLPKWLHELQQRSWEPEILLSGIVLYGMFKVPELLEKFGVFFKSNIFGNSTDINNLVGLSKMGIYWLITGLILHLICRGIWIGMVGLSYTFPNGINKEGLNYAGKFDEKVTEIPSYEAIVIRLEKISSSLFSVSFMLFMSLIGGYLFFLILAIIPFTIAYIYFDIGFQGKVFDIFKIYIYIIFSLGIIGLVDFLSLGYFRRFKIISKIYWPLHRVISSLTLSRFYRPIYYGMVSNFNKWVFFIFLTFFTIISLIGAITIASNNYPGQSYSKLQLWGSTLGYNAFSGYYQDQNQEQFSTQAQIQSDVITGDVIKLFVPANISFEDEMMEMMSLDSLKKMHPDTSSLALNLMLIRNFYSVEIDGKSIDVNRWYTRYQNSTGQFGYLAFININMLPEGTHHLVLGGKHEKFGSFANIPFYRDVSLIPNIPKESRIEKKDVDFQPKPFGIRD